MDIQSRKIEFVQEFLKIQSEDVISHFEKLLKKEKNTEAKRSSSPMSIAELNKRIDQSENDFKNGNYVTSTELIAK